MPFTISHAAIAPPLQRVLGRDTPILPLAVGTMAPNLELFLWGRNTRSISHEAHGVVLFDLPLALLFLAGLTLFVVPAIVTLMPERWIHFGPALGRSFTMPLARWTDAKLMARTITAIMIGAGSHLLWDDFTHAPQPGSVAMGWLGRVPFSLGDTEIAVHSLLGWVSTIGGLVFVVATAAAWFRRQPHEVPVTTLLEPTPTMLRAVGWSFVALMTVGFAIQSPLAFLGGGPARPTGTGDLAAISVVWALSGCTIALGLFGAAVRLGLVERWASAGSTSDSTPVPVDNA